MLQLRYFGISKFLKLTDLILKFFQIQSHSQIHIINFRFTNLLYFRFRQPTQWNSILLFQSFYFPNQLNNFLFILIHQFFSVKNIF